MASRVGTELSEETFANCREYEPVISTAYILSHTTMHKAAIYIRVSEESHSSGHSPKEQEPMLRELADSKGYKVVRVFEDAAKSD